MLPHDWEKQIEWEKAQSYGCIAGKHQSQQTEACEIMRASFVFWKQAHGSCSAEIPAHKQEQQMLSRRFPGRWAAFANPHSYSKHSVCLQLWLRRDESWPGIDCGCLWSWGRLHLSAVMMWQSQQKNTVFLLYGALMRPEYWHGFTCK